MIILKGTYNRLLQRIESLETAQLRLRQDLNEAQKLCQDRAMYNVAPPTRYESLGSSRLNPLGGVIQIPPHVHYTPPEQMPLQSVVARLLKHLGLETVFIPDRRADFDLKETTK